MSNFTLLKWILGGVCAVSSITHAGTYAPRVGKPHPDFLLPEIATGRPMSLSQFRGKKVLLVHFASW